MKDISVLILAGGKSSRMGQDKALLKVYGQPLLLNIYQTAKQISNQVFIVTSFPNKYQPILPKNAQFIVEPSPPQGPLIAFSYALSFVETEWTLLLACDLIYLKTEDIKSWLNYLDSISDSLNDKIALLSPHKKGWECLCGFYHNRCYHSLSNSINKGNTSFQGWLKGENIEPLLVENTKVFFNCNRPEDLPSHNISSSSS